MLNEHSRLTQEPFPLYSYVPGMHPHPVSDPNGHSYGRLPLELDGTDQPTVRDTHRSAIDMFNFGYYWESHEMWEAIWHALGRDGSRASFVKGLIKLAAAGVKAREGNSTGVERHAGRASELFEQSTTDPAFCSGRDFGLSAVLLRRLSLDMAKRASSLCDPAVCAVRVVMPFVLDPV